MFGHRDDQPQQDYNSINDDQANGGDQGSSQAADYAQPAADQGQTDQSWQHPGAPIYDNQSPVPAPSDDSQSAPVVAAPTDSPSNPFGSPTPPHPDEAVTHDLIDLKQKALGQLQPLVGKLEQSPEEKFRTLMMMIQASDDQSLVKEAYETAQSITDEKTKAQALLDIVNEINYFTSQHQPENQ